MSLSSRGAWPCPLLPPLVCAASLVLLVPITAPAQDCTDWAVDYPPVLGTLAPDPNVSVVGVAVEGSFAYVSEQWGDPGLGGYARVTVVDVADPATPAPLGTVDFLELGEARSDIAVWKQHVYVPGSIFGIFIVDATIPTAPMRLGLVPGSGFTLDVAVRAETSPGANDAVLCALGQGFRLYDLAAPAAPSLLGSVSVGGDFVSAAGGYAYVTDGEAGVIHVIEISGPGAPSLVTSVAIPGPPSGVWAQSGASGQLYVGTYQGVYPDFDGLHLFDLSMPEAPVYLGSAETFWAGNVSAADGTAYVVTRGGIAVVNGTEPNAPRLLGVFPGGGASILAAGDLLFCARRWRGLEIVDVSVPEVVPIIGGLGLPGHSSSITVSGNTAFVASAANLLSVDLTDSAAPDLVGGVDTPAAAWDVVLAGNLAFVACDNAGLQVVDVGDPTTPEIVGSASTLGEARAVALINNLACIADRNAGLTVLDVSDPTAPTFITNVPAVGPAVDVAASENQVYVAADWNGLHIVDLSTPQVPTVLSTVAMEADAVTVVDERAYVASYDELVIVDVANPSAPTVLNEIITSSSPRSTVIDDGLAYVATWKTGVDAFDVAIPEAATLLGKACSPVGGDEVALQGDLVIAVSGALNIFPGHCPSATAVTPLPSPPPPTTSIRAYPNPMRGSATVELESGSGGADLRIFDATGRLVRALCHHSTRNAPHALIWDGRDETGQRVARGVYWLRLEDTEGGVRTARLTVLR